MGIAEQIQIATPDQYWQTPLDKPSQFVDGRQTGSWPETGFWELSLRFGRGRALGGLSRKAFFSTQLRASALSRAFRSRRLCENLADGHF
jgi:hypothetical protein